MREKVFTEMSYDELRDALGRLPMTWYPALIRAMVEASLAKGVWLPMMGAGAFVESVEAEWRKNNPTKKRVSRK